MLRARHCKCFPSDFESEQQQTDKVGWLLSRLPFLLPSPCLYLFFPIQARGSFFPEPLNLLSRESRLQSFSPQYVLKSHLRSFHYEPYYWLLNERHFSYKRRFRHQWAGRSHISHLEDQGSGISVPEMKPYEELPTHQASLRPDPYNGYLVNK